MPLQLGHRRLNITGIDDEDVLPAEPHEQQAVRGQGKHVIQRNGGNQHPALGPERRPDPGLRLQHIRNDIAMREHGALGDTGRTAGVLQEGDVLGADVHRVHLFALACGDGGLERARAVDLPRTHLLLDVPDDEVDDGALREGQVVADAGDQHVLHLRLRQHLLDDVGEILQHDDRRGARIGELVLQLAGRIQRVGIDDRHAHAQGPEQRDGVLKNVRQHDRQPISLLEPGDLLQPRRERA